MFRGANPFDDIVANATSETLTSENWDAILTICEKVDSSGENAGRDCVAAVQKRLGNSNANVILYSLTLCESLTKNCGLKVQREISSRAFTSLLVKILNEKTTHPAVKQRILELIQQWAFEFRSDPTLGIMDETYQLLRVQSKFKFPSPQKPKKELKSQADKRKEEEELQLALALSLSASEHKEWTRSNSSSAAAKAATPAPVKRVRALYDFEPTESGELGFQKDDIIVVLATSYQDWWKGELFGRQGIFPVNYVEEIKERGPDEIVQESEDEAQVLQEGKNVDGLILMLSSVDPRRDNFTDNNTLQDMYNNALGIRPKLVDMIKKYGNKKDEMALLSEKLARARATYETMMEQSIAKYSNNNRGGYTNNIGGYQLNGSIPSTPGSTFATANPGYYAQGAIQQGQQSQAFVPQGQYQIPQTPQQQPQYQSQQSTAQASYQPQQPYQDPSVLQNSSQYAPQQPQQQPQQQFQPQPLQHQPSFDTAYAPQLQGQNSQQQLDYSSPPMQQPALQQQPLMQAPYAQQPPQQQQQQQPQFPQQQPSQYVPDSGYASSAPPVGYAPQPQYATAGTFQ